MKGNSQLLWPPSTVLISNGPSNNILHGQTGKQGDWPCLLGAPFSRGTGLGWWQHKSWVRTVVVTATKESCAARPRVKAESSHSGGDLWALTGRAGESVRKSVFMREGHGQNLWAVKGTGWSQNECKVGLVGVPMRIHSGCDPRAPEGFSSVCGEFVVFISYMLCGFTSRYNLTSYLRVCFKISKCLQIFILLTIVINFWFNEWLEATCTLYTFF